MEQEKAVEQRRKYEPPYVVVFSDEDLANAEKEAFLTSCRTTAFCPPVITIIDPYDMLP